MKFLKSCFGKTVLFLALSLGPVAGLTAQSGGVPSGVTYLTAADLQSAWNSSVTSNIGREFFTRPMTLAEAQQLLPFWNRLYQLQTGTSAQDIASLQALARETIRLGLGSDFWQLLASGFTGGAAASSTSNAQVVNNTIQTSVFAKAEPAISVAAREKAKAAAGARDPVVFGADAFYSRHEFDGGAVVKGYGTNLSLTSGDRFQFRGTLPIYRTEFGGSRATTYGFDANGKYRVSQNFAVGAHANYLKNDGNAGDSKSWTAGVYAAAAARASETSVVSFGLLLDRQKPESADETWLGAAGLNWGIALGQATALNPYAVYYRTFDAPRGSDRDWYDLGVELQFNLSETWAFKAGMKTTLGQRGLDRSYQVYLGSGWKF